MNESEAFAPDWASPPGDTILDLLNEQELSLLEFAHRMGQSQVEADDLIEGLTAITPAIASRLHAVLGPSASFWMARDSHYWKDLERLNLTPTRAPGETEWLRTLPLADMVKFGWLAKAASAPAQAQECLRFFNASTVQEWRAWSRGTLDSAAFRTSPSFRSQEGAVSAWLRQGEILANGVLCKPWDPERFQEQIPRIRDLCNKKIPSIFPTLQSLCSDCGVAAIVLQAPSGCRASGATRFLSPSKALLLLSFRYLSDDHFWFSFFHEAGHLLLHGERFVSVEGMDRSTSSQEHEANQFAANVLIPPEERQRMLALRSEFREIVRFALRIGVSPGVVVGQLQHAGRLGPHQQNRLKRRFSWEREE